MLVGEKLKKIRESRNLSVEKVAKDLDLTRQAIYQYENNSRIPRDEIKMEIANYYNLTVEEIFFNKKATKRCNKDNIELEKL